MLNMGSKAPADQKRAYAKVMPCTTGEAYAKTAQSDNGLGIIRPHSGLQMGPKIGQKILTLDRRHGMRAPRRVIAGGCIWNVAEPAGGAAEVRAASDSVCRIGKRQGAVKRSSWQKDSGGLPTAS